MARLPKAREKVLEAARRIVETKGAGHLTFDELASVSGVTRGGITYHFPTKEALLKGMIESDIAEWETAAGTLEPLCGCGRTAAVLGQIRCNLDPLDAGHKRFVSGLMGAAMTDPSLLDPIREHQRRKFSEWTWDETDQMRYLMLLAAEGVFWQDFFDLNPLPPEARARITRLIEKLAQHPEMWPAQTDPT
jgi:AcrR family transcriptional regulator